MYSIFLGILKNKNRGPGALQHQGGKCIHISKGGHVKPSSGQYLQLNEECGETRLEFKLTSDHKLKHKNHNMCVRPANNTDGSQVGENVICPKKSYNTQVGR